MRENYGNQWVNLDLELGQIHLSISVIFFPSIFFPHNQTHHKEQQNIPPKLALIPNRSDPLLIAHIINK
jgi:hypothetical protein